MSIIGWLVLGLIAGVIGSKIVNKSGQGVLLDINMPTCRATLIATAFLAATTVVCVSHAQVSGATNQSTHIGGSTGTGQTSTDMGGPIAPAACMRRPVL